MTALVVAACLLAAVSPWWAARALVERRATTVGAGPTPDDGSVGGTTGSSRGSRRAADEARIEIGVVLELLAAAVRAGASVPRALDAVGAAVGGPDGAALRAAGAALVLGASWDAAWSGGPGRIAVVQRALRPAWVHGAAPAPSLRATGETLRQDRTAAAKAAAGRLAVHLVLPLGACYLPAFVLVGLLPVLISLGSGLLGGG
jgi:hypothetical protein